jgi:hypothetical protein
MATTTPNFGWPVPTSTDLVKDGATAIEALGDSIDASLLDLKGGTTGQVLSKNTNTDMDFTWVTSDDANAIQNTIEDAKGDLIGATAADTPARLAVGTNGQILTADSTAATGLAWATASSGGMTSIASGSLTGTSVVLSSIPATYKNLQLVLRDVYITGTGAPNIKVNSVSNYNMLRYVATGGTIAADALTGNGSFSLGYNNMKTSDNNSCTVINIYDYTNSVAKEINALISYQNSGSAEDFMNYNGNAVMSAAVTSITIAGVTFAGGTYILYGVN